MKALCVVVMMACGVGAWGQHIPGYNYDEAKVPAYTLLDPLTMADGAKVGSAKDWWGKRRPEIVRLFEENMYGRTPANAKVPLRAHVVETDAHALGGLAVRKQIDLYFTDKGADGAKMRMLLYLPAQAVAAKKKSGVVLGLNFSGNHTVVDDPGVLLTPVWTKAKGATELTHALPDVGTRGSQVKEWQVEEVLRHGYGLATIYYGDIEPDFKDSAQFGVRALFGATSGPDDWGALGAWAWGLSRAVDYLVSDPAVNSKEIALTGHSRLGKATDWAAAQDARIAVVLSTESGKAGQSLSRRVIGETVEHLQHSFPYWFCGNYARWVGKDTEIPADGNLLLSLIAPRPVYVASAIGDEWSDPKGEYLSAVSASRVYGLLGKKGLSDGPMPAVDVPEVSDAVAYHVRAGKHDVTAFDWEQYLKFLDKEWGSQK